MLCGVLNSRAVAARADANHGLRFVPAAIPRPHKRQFQHFLRLPKFRAVVALLCVPVVVLGVAGQEKPSTPAIPSVPVPVNVSNASVSLAQPLSAPKAAQTPPPARSPAPVISEQKLTDARKTIGNLANGTVKVIVNLAPPPELAGTDFASKASLETLRPQIKKLQQDVLDNLPAKDVKVGFRFDNIAGFSAEVTTNGLKALQSHPRVVSIEPVFILEAHLAQGIPLMHGMTYRSNYYGAGLAIAICDSGIDYTHARLGGGGFPNSKVIGGYDFGDNDADPIPNGQAHGTCCAGIAAGDLGTVVDYIGGVAYGAKLYALKITSGTSLNATNDALVAAWDWCVTHKNDNTNFPIMVISTSAGIGRAFSVCDDVLPSMTTAANNAVAAGITVIASSGNDGFCDSMNWPACISSVISVGGVYDAAFGQNQPCVNSNSCAPKIATIGCPTGWYANDSTAADEVTSYANMALYLTLMAPADQCYTLDITGTSGYKPGDYYDSFGGTSAAAAYAAGAVACLQSAAKAITGNYLTPQQVKSCLVSYGDNVTDTKVAITKPRVNLERAIQSFGTNLSFVSATLTGGNGNQSVDPNEYNDLKLVIRNDGSSTATNISATLTSTTPGLNVVQSSSTYPNLAYAATATNVTAFQISTSPSFVCGTPVNLTLILAYVGGTNTLPFNLASDETNYVITQSTGAAIVPGTDDVGNHGDDVTTTVALPFPYAFYDQSFTSAALDSNGNVQFASATSDAGNINLPASTFDNAIFAHWDDLRTDVGGSGIFTSTSGSVPNRIFNIEWRATYYDSGASLNFEVRLYEGQQRFDIIYGTLNGTGSSATVGVQKDTGSAFTQFEYDTGGLSNGLQLTFQQSCIDGGGVFLSAAVSGGNIALMFNTFTGLTYVLQYKDSLADTLWQTLRSVPGDGANNTITVSNSTPSQRFFRLSVQ